MASTGTAVYTITGLGMVTSALRKMRVLIDGGAPSAQQQTDGLEDMNIMLKSWWARPGGGLKVWCYQTIPVPMIAGKVAYTIGPSGADITNVRPLRVLADGNYIRQTVSGSPHDTPLRLLSRTEYNQFGVKLAQGVPNSIYYNAGIDTAAALTSASGFGTLYVYVAPQDTSRTIYLNAQRPLYDMTLASEFDLPPEWFHAIRLNLMASMGDDYEVPEDRLGRYIMQAKEALEMAAETSIEEASTTFMPDFTGMR